MHRRVWVGVCRGDPCSGLLAGGWVCQACWCCRPRPPPAPRLLDAPPTHPRAPRACSCPPPSPLTSPQPPLPPFSTLLSLPPSFQSHARAPLAPPPPRPRTHTRVAPPHSAHARTHTHTVPGATAGRASEQQAWLDTRAAPQAGTPFSQRRPAPPRCAHSRCGAPIALPNPLTASRSAPAAVPPLGGEVPVVWLVSVKSMRCCELRGRCALLLLALLLVASSRARACTTIMCAAAG